MFKKIATCFTGGARAARAAETSHSPRASLPSHVAETPRRSSSEHSGRSSYPSTLSQFQRRDRGLTSQDAGPSSFRRYSSDSPRAPYAEFARMYEATRGKLRNYDNARIMPSADLATWADTYGMLPEDVNSIADIGAAQGTVVAWLGQRYPEASILALDTDRRSAQFINAKIKDVLSDPERVHAFTGTLEHAFAKKICHENSIELVNMQAVAPYLSDEELEETLANIHKALVPGGKLMISCYGEHHFLDESKRNINLRTDLQMCGLLHDAGFLVECVGNKLDNGKPNGASEKTCYELRDVGSTSIPAYSENEKYWHTVNIVASAYKE